MAFVLHAQWLEPMSSGANLGDCYLVTDTGYEKLTCHTAAGDVQGPCVA